MKKLAILVFASVTLGAAALATPDRAEAASPWADHWATAYVHSDPSFFASLDIRGHARIFYLELHDSIPPDAWHAQVCGGPADAWGVGILVDPTHMRADFLWRCRSDGSFHFATNYFRFGNSGDSNPANDTVVYCTGPAATTCGLSFGRAP